MTSVYFEQRGGDERRREHLYAGDIYVYRSTPATRRLADFAMELIEEAFDPYPAREAQFHMPVEDWVARFAPVKPLFIHHEKTREIMVDVSVELGCDPDETYLDVPRLRGVTSHGYLTSGVGYAHHPHRDTWYSAPMCQLNWWLPLHDLVTDASMAFFHDYHGRAIENGSAAFDYYEWNAVSRKEAAKHVTSDTRPQPKAEEALDLSNETRYIPERAGVIAFSAAQLHAAVPNTRLADSHRLPHRQSPRRCRVSERRTSTLVPGEPHCGTSGRWPPVSASRTPRSRRTTPRGGATTQC
jgi:hypothetical protein